MERARIALKLETIGSFSTRLPRVFMLASAFFSLAVSAKVHAQNVTWSAQGLPPGISLQIVDGDNARLSGTPGKAGIYNVTVYPVVQGVVGDMTRFRLNVFPKKNVSLPVYYKYSREDQYALAGGGGAILCRDGDGSVAFTTNGVDFKTVSLPAAFSKEAWSWTAAAAGGRFVLMSSRFGEMAYSDNLGGFKNLPLPPNLKTYLKRIALASNGSNRFFLVADTYSLGKDFSLSPGKIQIFTLTNNETVWSQPFVIPATRLSNLEFASFAAKGNTLILALSGWGDPLSLLHSKDNGNSWSIVKNAPRLISVAYGNGIFLGTTPKGVFKSQDGLTWTRVSNDSRGKIIFSSKENLFFTANGITRDGIEWSDYENEWRGASFEDSVASTGDGVIFFYNAQLSTTYIPTYRTNSHEGAQGKVGEPFVKEITLD